MSGNVISSAFSGLIKPVSNNMIPSTPLANQVKACRNGISVTEPRLAHRSDAGDLMVNFTTIHAREARDALFANGRDSRGAFALFLKSGNRYAKEEVTQFAKVYHQLKQQKLSPEDNKQLDTLAAKYVAKMVDDGLGSKSGFGAWTQKTNKCYQQRNKLEHSLAEIASKVCGDKYERLADSLLPEVTQFIFSSIETELGRPLEEGSFKTVMDLIDNRAKQAWESLRGYRTELLQERGAGVGKLSRDLDTVAILPELLRKLLPAIVEQLKPESAHPQAGTDSQPDAVDGETKPQSPHSAMGSPPPTITINVGDIHINQDDHSVKRDDHSDRRHYSAPADANQARSANATAAANASSGLASDAASEMGSKTLGLKDVLTQARVVDLRSESATLKRTHWLKPEIATSEPTHRLKPESALSESIHRPQPDVIAGSTDSNKGDLHYAARQVASALTELFETAKPSAVATSASLSTLISPTVTEISSSGLASSSKSNSESLPRQDSNSV
ncbi:MAG: hypothetical protein ACRC9O_13165, partial [Plesiomonas sp.]|uniref:hypothetical protein n=1 Tax=Plesiomonas sp. TaxID=2486279 RepID=UPI003F3CD851